MGLLYHRSAGGQAMKQTCVNGFAMPYLEVGQGEPLVCVTVRCAISAFGPLSLGPCRSDFASSLRA